MKDWILIVWILVAAIWDTAVFGTATYLIFLRDYSGWWYLMAIILTSSPTLLKVLRKRYGIAED